MDGNAGIQMVSAMFDLTPEIATVPPPQEWSPDAVPGDLSLLTRAAGSLAMQPFRTARATERGLRAVMARRRIAADRHGTVASTLPAGAPKVSFSATLTPERSFAFRTLSLRDVKAVGRATGATVNDVVLAVVGQGLAKWLEERGEAVERSLVAMVPMSFRGNGADASEANQLMNMFIQLGTDLADPLQRLAFIAEQTSSAKAQLSDGPGDPVRELSELSPATVTAHLFRYAAAHHLADRMTPLFNLTMSNLRGSPTPLFLGGALMVANYPLAPIYDGNGLNITVMSYQQQIDVGVVGCPQLTPDVDRIPLQLEMALDDLVQLTA
jgi:WS/DGAT/MGAT family acyltransferase